MTGENGTPETPDWIVTPRHCTILDFLAARMRRSEQEPIPDNITLGTE